MCILLLTTSHPEYPLILLSNRDEFLHRRTARAAFWDPPNTDILSGRDLARPEKGTWLGITTTGRICVLTNCREAASAAAIGEKSRGAMVTSFLTSTLPPRAWIHDVLTTGEARGVGGFSLCCGVLRKRRPALAVISNRTAARDDGFESTAHWIDGGGGARGLSNSLFDEPWPKVEIGTRLLEEAVSGPEERLVERCFGVLSHDTLPAIHEGPGGDTYETELQALPKSVFIPPFSTAVESTAEDIAAVNPKQPKGVLLDTGEQGGVENMCAAPTTDLPHDDVWRKSPSVYGTQTQTVVLVRNDGWVRYTERRLYDEECLPVPEGERDVVVEFQIEGWEDEDDA